MPITRADTLISAAAAPSATETGSVMVVAGARPNFMKVAPILSSLERASIAHVLVHTGQHYDAAMSDTFFEDLGIKKPDFNLGVGSGSHATQTALVMQRFEPVFMAERPRWLVVVGDVNSTLACALVAAKLRAETGTLLAHVEAGLRSGDWEMPEEVNRVLTDRLADVLFLPSRDARENLLLEGIDERRIVFVGNVMVDTLFSRLPQARERSRAEWHGLRPRAYALVTLHRPSNVDSAESLCEILTACQVLSRDMPVLFPVHPRTRGAIERHGLGGLLQNLTAIPPEGYLDMLSLVDSAAVVVTDSGGLQEETTALGIPCVTVREGTERPITVTEGSNRLVTWPPTVAGIVDSVRQAVYNSPSANARRPIEGWDGHAADRIVEFIARHAACHAVANGV